MPSIKHKAKQFAARIHKTSHINNYAVTSENGKMLFVKMAA
jgi:hypothetical protein